MAREIPDLTKPSTLCSIHSPDGYEYVLAQSTPAAIELRMRNLTSNSLGISRSGGTGAPSIAIDFSAAGGAVAYTSLTPCTGFREASSAAGVLTLELAYSQLWWYPRMVWTVKFDGFSIDAPAGVGWVEIAFNGILPESATNKVYIPLVRLAPPSIGNKARLMGGWGKGNNQVQVSASGQRMAPSALELELSAPAGSNAEVSQASGIYLGFVSGNWPSLPAVASPSEAYKSRLHAIATDWDANNISRTRMPLWRLAPEAATSVISGEAGHAAGFRLDNLVSRQKPGYGYMAVYNFGVPGFDDGVAGLQVALDSGDVQITQFTATPTSFEDITAPQPVTLTWQTVNASVVLLTGYGTVTASGTLSPSIEGTTTFVLTALDSAMQTAVSQSQIVTVSPDLVTRLVPLGVIVPWNGTGTAPAGWSTCDGTNGTPDLTDKFIVGVGTESVGSSGAGDLHNHPVGALSDTFTTSTDGSHHHGMPTNWYARYLTSGGGLTGIDSNGQYSSSTQTQSDGDHSHPVDVSIGPFSTDNNATPVRPAWYALYFIIKSS